MPRIMGRNKQEVGAVGAVSGKEDPFYGNSPSDHQHQFVENHKFLELLGTFTDISPYPPCRIFSIGNIVYIHGVIQSSGPESDICVIPDEFLPDSLRLPLFLLTPLSSVSAAYYPLFIDIDKILKFASSDTFNIVELSMLRYIKQ